MSPNKKTLFESVVPADRLCKAFEIVRTAEGDEPAREMMDEVYQDFTDPEGNFLEQFQTTGFDARVFELYLFAYFTRSGYKVYREHPKPDFVVERNGLRVAVEATTVNPLTSGVISEVGKKISELSDEGLRDYTKDELPIRFGSPLFSKLKKRYWELDHCRALPFVIAIEAFHDEDALGLSDSALLSYLYGMEHSVKWLRSGTLDIAQSAVEKHSVGDKSIPSGFFLQPDSEHVSAVVFTNAGTVPKFGRMGYQQGIGCDRIIMMRSGYCFNPDPDARDPSFFSYSLDSPPLVESWGQGLVVMHNPRSLRPLPRDYFVEAVQGYVTSDGFRTDHAAWHPMASKTLILSFGEAKKELNKVAGLFGPRIAVAAIPKRVFQRIFGIVHDDNPIIDEQGWFADETESFLGVVFRDKVDNDWGYAVLARDQWFHFRWIQGQSGMPSRENAVREVQAQIVSLLSSPKRIFPQG